MNDLRLCQVCGLWRNDESGRPRCLCVAKPRKVTDEDAREALHAFDLASSKGAFGGKAMKAALEAYEARRTRMSTIAKELRDGIHPAATSNSGPSIVPEPQV